MGQLTNLYVSSSYQGLLKMTDSTQGLTNTLQTIQTGDGDDSPLQMSLTQVNISGSFFINNVPITNGTNGTSGTSGINGTSGTSGSNGTDGSSGTSGTSGSNGTDGSSGTSGSSGSDGSSGTSGSNGTDGSSGTSGSNGTDGSSGTSGLSNSFFNYQANTNSTSGDPGSGHLLWNNAIQSGATQINLSELTQLNDNVDVFLRNLAEGSTIIIQKQTDYTKYQEWTIGTSTDVPTYWVFNVTLQTSNYSFSNDEDVIFIVVTTPSGTSGTSGTSGSNGSDGSSGTSGDSLFALTGSVWNTTNNVGVTGSLNVTGSFINNGLTYPLVDNGVKSFIQTDGAGNLSLEYVDSLYENVRNMEATTLQIGTPLFVSGQTGDNANVYIADSNNPARRPATLIAADNITASNTGRGLILGLITNVDTNAYTAGQEVYLAAGGGFTGTRPTGSALVQLLGIVTRVGNNGQGYFLNPGPYNLPNLTTGKVWMGDSNSYPSEKTTSEAGFITTGSISTTQQITGSLILDNTIISGSLIGNTINGGLIKIQSEANRSGSVQYNITGSSPISQSNIIMGGAGPTAANLTGSIVISGSNNILTNSARPNTLVTQGTYGYIGGNGNITNTIPTLNTGSLLRPTISNNNFQGATVALNFTTSSLSGGEPSISNNIVNGGTLTLNLTSGSITVNNNNISNTITHNGTVTPFTVRPNFTNNIVMNSTTYNHFSSSISSVNNILGNVTINNTYFHTGSNNNVTFNRNVVLGQNQIVNYGGNPATNVARSIGDNIIGGINNVVSMEQTGTNSSSLYSTLIFGNGLIVTGSNTAIAAGGSTFVGRWNATGSLQESTNETIFVVGTGTSAAARRNAIHIDSNSNTRITGSLLISGSVNITGSLGVTNIVGTGSLFLQPNQGDVRFLEIYNTSPTDTHITASGGQIFIGDDVTYVKVDNYGSVKRIDVVADNGINVSGSVQVTGSLNVTNGITISGSVNITGSVQGNVNALSISSNTASLNLNDGNFFTLQLVSGSNTRIEPSNIKVGQTINILLSTTGSATVSFPTSVLQVSGSSYVPTTTTSKDIITLISFDSTNLYLANVKNLI